MKQAIIVDLDGTLFNCDHRLVHIKKQPKDWKTFHDLVWKDSINEWCAYLVKRMMNDFDILIVSGRVQESRVATVDAISRNLIRIEGLWMREPDDFRDDHIIKKEIYEKHIKGKWEVAFVLEDRQRVVDMWRQEGLICLQCADGNF